MSKIYEQMNLLDELNVLLFLLSADMTVQYANHALLKFSGLTMEDLVGLPAWELPMWQHSAEAQNDLMFACGHVFSLEMAKRIEITPMNNEGDLIELDLYMKPLIEDGIVSGIIAVGYNITELVQARKSLTTRERQIGAFFKNSTQGYFFQTLPEPAILPEVLNAEFADQVYEAQRLSSLSSKVYQYLGIQEDGGDIDVMSLLNISIEERRTLWIEMFKDGVATIKRELLSADTGKKVFLELKFVAIFIDDIMFDGNFCIVTNITQQYIYEKELNFLANKDPLTGLNNRRNFRKLANDEIDRKAMNYVVGMMDIDKFKNVNDTYGHDVGDIALRQVAEVIDNAVSDDGIVGRYGGEEFIILLPMSLQKGFTMLENLRRTIENVQIHYGSGTLKVTISGGCFGFQFYTEDDLNQAITLSDRALYEAKNTGRNKIVVYDDALHGLKAIDKLTGTYTRVAFMYKHKQFHEELRKSDVQYGVVAIKLSTLIENPSEILSQFVKQTAGILHGILREKDIVGRYNELTFMVLINSVDENVVNEIVGRTTTAVYKLSDKFDKLVDAEISSRHIHDWLLDVQEIYDEVL